MGGGDDTHKTVRILRDLKRQDNERDWQSFFRHGKRYWYGLLPCGVFGYPSGVDEFDKKLNLVTILWTSMCAA